MTETIWNDFGLEQSTAIIKYYCFGEKKELNICVENRPSTEGFGIWLNGMVLIDAGYDNMVSAKKSVPEALKRFVKVIIEELANKD